MHRRLFALVLTFAVLAPVSSAWAAAEVHKLNLVLSAAPSEIKGGDLNRNIDYLNRNFLEAAGLEGLDNITYGWLFGAELRYFVRPDWAFTAGVGQLKQQSVREYLPALQQQVQIRQEILSVPVHIGGAFYFAPYNQGDFQARAFLGGGIMSLATNRVTSQVSNTFGGSSVSRINGPGPGFYGEGGVQMFFASRFSVILSGMYRGAKSSNMVVTEGPEGTVNQPAYNGYAPTRYELDASGLGFKVGMAIGL